MLDIDMAAAASVTELRALAVVYQAVDAEPRIPGPFQGPGPAAVQNQQKPSRASRYDFTDFVNKDCKYQTKISAFV